MLFKMHMKKQNEKIAFWENDLWTYNNLYVKKEFCLQYLPLKLKILQASS